MLALSHLNIVTIDSHSSLPSGDVQLCFQNCSSAVQLSERIEVAQEVSPRFVLQCMYQILLGLCALHKKGICHGHISLSAVLLFGDEQAGLFRLANPLQATFAPALSALSPNALKQDVEQIVAVWSQLAHHVTVGRAELIEASAGLETLDQKDPEALSSLIKLFETAGHSKIVYRCWLGGMGLKPQQIDATTFSIDSASEATKEVAFTQFSPRIGERQLEVAALSNSEMLADTIELMSRGFHIATTPIGKRTIAAADSLREYMRVLATEIEKTKSLGGLE